MRLSEHSWAVAEKLVNDRVTPGRLSELKVKEMASVPKKAARTAALAPLTPLWPEVYDGWFGVTSSGVQAGSAAVSGLPSVSAARIAVTGRQKLYVYLASQTAIAASAWVTLSRANRRAFCASELPCCLATAWAIWSQ